jgi:hypothetical protein
MVSSASRIAMVCVLACGLLLWPGVNPAASVPRGAPAFAAGAGQEVATGSYTCSGVVYTNDPPHLGASAYLSATSGITAGYFGTSQYSAAAPADLDALAEACDTHVERVFSQAPAICVLGPVTRYRQEYTNGTSVGAGFEFSCQGTRDEVVGVIGGFSRLSLTERLP